MASSEDNNNDGDMGFQPRSGVTMEMSTGSMFNNKSSSGSAAGNLFGSGWDPLENFGGSSSMVPQPNEFGGGSSAYPVGLENHQGLLQHYQSGSGIGDLLPKLGSFGSGSFSEMVSPFVNLNPECGAQRISEDNNNNNNNNNASSPNRRDKRRASHAQFNPIKNGEGEQRNDVSGDSSENMNEQNEKKQKTEHGDTNPDLRGKQMAKHAKDNSNNSGGAPKDTNYIHVRAKRGQATNSHSLAERVRRERISERMKLLQELVPGCNKITGKAVMLDEIINYVQSLQQQVEFLSMKLATVNPEMNIDLDRILSKDILHSRATNPSPGLLGFVPGLGSSQPYPQGSLAGIPTTTPFHPIHPQPVWDNDLHNLLQMGFDSNPGINNLGPSGRSKLDL